MQNPADALSGDREGTIIAIEVIAGAKSGVFPDGYNEWRKAVGCRVAAPAIGGKANRAIMRLISEVLHVPASSVSIRSGSTSSQKRVLVKGLDKEEVLMRLNPLF